MKACSKCGAEKPLTEFFRNKKAKDGLDYRCKACSQANSKAWREKNPERWRSNQAAWRYGISPDQYNQMLLDQGGTCAICAKPCSTGRTLSVDHDHSCCPGGRSCGECVRGLLCAECNFAIGKFHDDAELLRAALNYLERKA